MTVIHRGGALLQRRLLEILDGAGLDGVIVADLLNAVLGHGLEVLERHLPVELGILKGVARLAQRRFVVKGDQLGLGEDIAGQRVGEVDIEHHVIVAIWRGVIAVFLQQAGHVIAVQAEIIGPMREVAGAQAVGLGARDLDLGIGVGERAVQIEGRLDVLGVHQPEDIVLIGEVAEVVFIVGEVGVDHGVAVLGILIDILHVRAVALLEVEPVFEALDLGIDDGDVEGVLAKAYAGVGLGLRSLALGGDQVEILEDIMGGILQVDPVLDAPAGEAVKHGVNVMALHRVGLDDMQRHAGGEGLVILKDQDGGFVDRRLVIEAERFAKFEQLGVIGQLAALLAGHAVKIDIAVIDGGCDIVGGVDHAAGEPEPVAGDADIEAAWLMGALGPAPIHALRVNGDIVGPAAGLIAGFGHKPCAIRVIGGVVADHRMAVVMHDPPARRAKHGVAFEIGGVVLIIHAGAVQMQPVAACDIAVIFVGGRRILQVVMQIFGFVGPAQLFKGGVADVDIVGMHHHHMAALVDLAIIAILGADGDVAAVIGH